MGKRLLSLLLLLVHLGLWVPSAPASVATTTTRWELRPSGNDTNGGGFDTVASAACGSHPCGGTNYAMQDSPVVSDTSAALSGTTLTLGASRSADWPTDIEGNIVQITSVVGGTCTANTNSPFWRIDTRTSTTVVTLSGTPCTVAPTSFTVKAGGGLTVNKRLKGNGVAGEGGYFNPDQKIYVKTGTHNLTATWGGGMDVAPNEHRNDIFGYNTTWGDLDTTIDSANRPVISTNGNAIDAITLVNGGFHFMHLVISGAGATKGRAAVNGGSPSLAVRFLDVKMTTFDNNCVDFPGAAALALQIDESEVTDCNNAAGTYAIMSTATPVIVNRSYVHDNKKGGISMPTQSSVTDSVVANNQLTTGINFVGIAAIINSVIYGNVGPGAQTASTGANAGMPIIINNIFANNTTYGLSLPNNVLQTYPWIDYNAYWQNTTADALNLTKSAHEFCASGCTGGTLTGSPFTNAAGADWTLNNTVGAGKLLRGAGHPGPPMLGQTSYRDIGAYQHQDTKSGGARIIGGGL